LLDTSDATAMSFIQMVDQRRAIVPGVTQP
jgi:hypothetical protein